MSASLELPLDMVPRQIDVLEALRYRVLELALFSIAAEHPCRSPVFSILRRHFYWPSMTIDGRNIADNCV